LIVGAETGVPFLSAAEPRRGFQIMSLA